MYQGLVFMEGPIIRDNATVSATTAPRTSKQRSSSLAWQEAYTQRSCRLATGSTQTADVAYQAAFHGNATVHRILLVSYVA